MIPNIQPPDNSLKNILDKGKGGKMEDRVGWKFFIDRDRDPVAAIIESGDQAGRIAEILKFGRQGWTAITSIPKLQAKKASTVPKWTQQKSTEGENK